MVFPDGLKIAKSNSVFKGDDRFHRQRFSPTNGRPISVLPCFFSIPERIMNNHFYKCAIENKII